MKFNLKFKILLSIFVLLITCTTVNLVYSYKLFIEDKKSYIFESVLKKTENISDQINFKLEELENRFDLNSNFTNYTAYNSELFLNNQNDLILFGSLHNNQHPLFTNTKNINNYSTKFGLKVSDFTAFIDKKLQQSPGTKKGQWIFHPQNNLYFVVQTKFKNNDVLITVNEVSSLFEMFYKDSTFSNKVFDPNVDTQSTLYPFLKKLNFNQSKKGVLSDKIDGKEHLIGYTFINNNLLVISSINTEAAFSITRFLILKTSVFGFFLLTLGLIGGIYFSSSITFPIKNLTKAAEKVAAGDFSSQASVNTTDEIKTLSDTFNFMSSEIKMLLKNKEDLIAQLEDYSKNLEQMVADRTRELKEAHDFMALMVNSLDQGLLVFDKDLNCHPMFTKACEPIFGISPLDKNLTEVLGIQGEENIQSLKQWAMVTFNEMIPFESAIDLGPRNKITGRDHNDPHYKHVQIDYYPMRNEENKIFNLVLIATDKTNEIQATQLAKEKESYVSMILKILNNKTQFESFINEVEEIFEQFHSAYSLDNGTIEFDLCMMLFHTLNGGFGIYSITHLQQLAREYETEISNIKDNCPDIREYIPFLQNHISNLKEEFYKFRLDLDGLVGTKFSSNISIAEIPRAKIIELKTLIYSTENSELIKNFSEGFLKIEVINYFKAYDDLCKTTAVKIGKEFKGLTFHNEQLKVEPENYLEFFNVLVHLFRNCLDHGLEDSYTRESKGKSADGHIEVAFNEISIDNKNFLSIRIQDDGSGIDPNIIRARYNKLRPDEDISHLKDEEVIYKIFDPFFSTRDEVSALSGRGVGMSAIKEVVERMNGQIEIISTVGSGTSFSFLFPQNDLF